MAALDDLVELLGRPPYRFPKAQDWAEVESYVGSAMPSDFKAFLDRYGSGAMCGELVVFHPRGSSPLLERMRGIHESFGQAREKHPEDYPYAFHPEPGGLISWGYDPSGDEHFFLPSDPDADRWKVVTMVHEVGVKVFEGSFAEFALTFVRRLCRLDADFSQVEPDDEDWDEWAELGMDGPMTPSFEPF